MYCPYYKSLHNEQKWWLVVFYIWVDISTENASVSNLPRVNRGRKLHLATLTWILMTLVYGLALQTWPFDLDLLWPPFLTLTLWPWPLTKFVYIKAMVDWPLPRFSDSGLKKITTQFYVWPWPLTLTFNPILGRVKVNPMSKLKKSRKADRKATTRDQ